MEDSELKLLSPDSLSEKLKLFSDEQLLSLFNSRYTVVGDTAVEVLYERKSGIEMVIEALLSDKLTKKVSKIRAINFLLRFGNLPTEALNAYKYALKDKNEDVALTALFGIVFFQEIETLSHIEEWKAKYKPGDKCYEKAIKAIEALKRGNPYIFSPYYRDRKHVWGKAK